MGLVAATVLTPFVLWVKFGWPPKVSSQGWLWVWCWMFGIMMFSASSGLWQAGLWRDLLIVAAISAGVIVVMAQFAIPVAGLLGFISPTLPIYPVNP